MSGAGFPGRALHALPPYTFTSRPREDPPPRPPRSRDPHPASALPALRAARAAPGASHFASMAAASGWQL